MEIDSNWTPKQILLDLDGTLYPSTLGMERAIVPSLQRAAARALGLELDDALPVIHELNKRYGYCVRGLAAEHGIDPEIVVHETYRDIDRSGIACDIELRDALELLSGLAPVTILTNSSRAHAYDVLDRLGVGQLGLAVAAIEDVGFYLKPDNEVYLSIRESTGYAFAEMLYFDDSVRNLHSGWMAGMKCVLVHNGLASPPMFWENHLRIEHLPPEHIASTYDLPKYIREFVERRTKG